MLFIKYLVLVLENVSFFKYYVDLRRKKWEKNETWNFPAIVVGAPETVPCAASAIVTLRGVDFEILTNFIFDFIPQNSVHFRWNGDIWKKCFHKIKFICF